MSERQSVKVMHGALDEVEGGEIILRGAIDPVSLSILQVGDYQREIAPRARIADLAKAFKESTVPDIELGMRGQGFLEREGVYYLQDPVFIIDGLQRVTAARFAMQEGSVMHPRLGAAIHFDTTEGWERERFRILNMERQKLSPNIFLRNMRTDCGVVLLLHKLSLDKGFILCDRVSWSQRMRRQDLITALTLVKTAGHLHQRFGPGLSNRIQELGPALQKTMEKVGPNIFRDNMRIFFEIIDECWGIRSVTFKEGAIYLRTGFLRALSTLFSKHRVFWNGERLTVSADIKRKLAGFPVSDPHVRELTAASGTTAGRMLYQLLLDHVNRGKRSRRLRASAA